MTIQGFDAKTRAKVEELLGDRGKKDNRAVRFRDIAGISTSTNLDEVRKVAEKVARDIAEEYDGANVDLSELREDIADAQQKADQAASDALNAQSAVNGMVQYTDDAVATAKGEMAVDYAAAQTAAGQAAGYASDAQSSLLIAQAGIAKLFPEDFSEGHRYWQPTYAGSPNTPTANMTSDVTLLAEAAVGSFYRVAAGRGALRAIMSKAVKTYEAGRVIRVTNRLRTIGGTSAGVRLAVAVLRDDYTSTRTLILNIPALTTAGAWHDVVAEIALPAANANEVSFRVGLAFPTGITPDLVNDVAMIRIEDVTVARETDAIRAQATIARNDAVVARQDAESAAASAQSSLELAAEVAGRGVSVLSDQFLVASDWTRLGAQGTLLILSNVIYPVGRSWRFTVNSAQNDGIRISQSPETIWPGQTNADGFVIEVEYTLQSGGLGGAGIQLSWTNTAGTNFWGWKTLAEMQAGEGLAGRSRVARAVLRKPTGFTGTFASHTIAVHANATEQGWVRQAKVITFHRINVRPATAEEMGSGEVMSSVQAHLSTNYFTRAETNQAIANFDLGLNASLDGLRSSASMSATALAGINGRVARFSFVTGAGGSLQAAGFEMVSWDGTGAGSGSAIKLNAKDILLEGSVAMSQLVITDLANLVRNNWTGGDFDGWATSGSVVIQNRTDSVFSIDGIAGNMAVVTGGDVWLASATSTVSVDEPLLCELYIRRSSSTVPNGSALVQVRWTLNDGSFAYTNVGTVSSIATVKVSRIVYAPANAVRACLWIRPNVGGTTGVVFLARPMLRRATGSTLLTPNSVYSDNIVGDQVKAEHLNTASMVSHGLAIFGSEVRSSNFNLANGTGWRITQAGTMSLPKAIINRAHINGAIIGTAEIEDLAVERIKIAGSSVTTKERAYTAGTVNMDSSFTVLQTLSYVIGRAGSQEIALSFMVGRSNTYRFRLRRTNAGATETVWDQTMDINNLEEFQRWFIDVGMLSGSITYELACSSLNAPAGSAISRRYLGALNVFK